MLLDRVLATFDKAPPRPDGATDLEYAVIILRFNELAYGDIQRWTGCLGKKAIRQVLLKYAPELIELDCNHKKLKAAPSRSIEKRIINLLKIKNLWTIDTSLGVFEFYMKDEALWMKSELFGDSQFTSWDPISQIQLFHIINED